MSAVIKAMRSTKKISAAVSVSEMSSLVETDDAAKRALVRQGHSAAALQNDLRGAKRRDGPMLRPAAARFFILMGNH